MTTILALRSRGKEEREDEEERCLERLAEARSESERLAEELHRMKMEHWSE